MDFLHSAEHLSHLASTHEGESLIVSVLPLLPRCCSPSYGLGRDNNRACCPTPPPGGRTEWGIHPAVRLWQEFGFDPLVLQSPRDSSQRGWSAGQPFPFFLGVHERARSISILSQYQVLAGFRLPYKSNLQISIFHFSPLSSQLE